MYSASVASRLARTLRHDPPLHQPHPPAPAPLALPALSFDTLLPRRLGIHLPFLRPFLLTALPDPMFRPLLLITDIINPPLSPRLHLHARNNTLLNPFATPQIQRPFLLAPLPARRRPHILEEARAARPLVRDPRRAQRVVGRGAEQPGLPLAGPRQLVQLEDLDFARLRLRVEKDVGGDERVEPRGEGRLARRDLRIMGGREEGGDGWVAGEDEQPAGEEEEEAPGEEVRGDEHGGGGEEEGDEEGGGEELVGEVCGWGEGGDDVVVELREVLHAVLQVAHVAEEVFGELFDGLHGGRGRDGGSAGIVFEGGG